MVRSEVTRRTLKSRLETVGSSERPRRLGAREDEIERGSSLGLVASIGLRLCNDKMLSLQEEAGSQTG